MSEIAYPVEVLEMAGSVGVIDSTGQLTCAGGDMDARRIAACLNACRSLTTEQLERDGVEVILLASVLSAELVDHENSGSAAREG